MNDYQVYIKKNAQFPVSIPITTAELFSYLCMSLNISCLSDLDLDFDEYYEIKSYDDDEFHVYSKSTGELYDDRGDLYLALLELKNIIF